jgi:hypothetical protein
LSSNESSTFGAPHGFLLARLLLMEIVLGVRTNSSSISTKFGPAPELVAAF